MKCGVCGSNVHMQCELCGIVSPTLTPDRLQSIAGTPAEHMINIVDITTVETAKLFQRNESYGSSWKKRGGTGAFMMLARKWDRIENLSSRYGFDIFEAFNRDPSDSGIIDDIRDLRAYLLLVESHLKFEQSKKDPR